MFPKRERNCLQTFLLLQLGWGWEAVEVENGWFGCFNYIRARNRIEMTQMVSLMKHIQSWRQKESEPYSSPCVNGSVCMIDFLAKEVLQGWEWVCRAKTDVHWKESRPTGAFCFYSFASGEISPLNFSNMEKPLPVALRTDSISWERTLPSG